MNKSNNSKINFTQRINSIKDKLDKFANFTTFNNHNKTSRSIDIHNPILSKSTFDSENPNSNYLKNLNSNKYNIFYHDKDKGLNNLFADFNYAETNYVRLHQNNLFFIEKPDNTTLDFMENLLQIPSENLCEQIDQHRNELLVQNVLLPKFLNAVADVQNYRNNLAQFYQTNEIESDPIANIAYEWFAEVSIELAEKQAKAIDYTILFNQFLLQLYWIALQPEQVELIYQKGLVNSLKSPKYIFDNLHYQIFNSKFDKPINENLISLNKQLAYIVGFNSDEYEYITRPFYENSFFHKFKVDLNDYGLQSLPNFVRFNNLFNYEEKRLLSFKSLNNNVEMISTDNFPKYWLELSEKPNLNFKHYFNLQKFFQSVLINQIVPSNLFATLDWSNIDLENIFNETDFSLNQQYLKHLINHKTVKQPVLHTYSSQDLIDCYQLYGRQYLKFVLGKIYNFIDNFNFIVLGENEILTTKSKHKDLVDNNLESTDELGNIDLQYTDNSEQEQYLLDNTNSELVLKVKSNKDTINISDNKHKIYSESQLDSNHTQTLNQATKDILDFRASELNLTSVQDINHNSAHIQTTNTSSLSTNITNSEQSSNKEPIRSNSISNILKEINNFTKPKSTSIQSTNTQNLKPQKIVSNLDDLNIKNFNINSSSDFEIEKNAQYFFFNFNSNNVNQKLKIISKQNSKIELYADIFAPALDVNNNSLIKQYLVKNKLQFLRDSNKLIHLRQRTIIRSRLLNELVYGNFHALDSKYGKLFGQFYNLVKSLIIFKNLSDKLPKSLFLQAKSNSQQEQAHRFFNFANPFTNVNPHYSPLINTDQITSNTSDNLNLQSYKEHNAFYNLDYLTEQNNIYFKLDTSTNLDVNSSFNRLKHKFNPAMLLNFEIDLNQQSVANWHNPIEFNLSNLELPNQSSLQIECELITDLQAVLSCGRYYLVKAKKHNHYKFIYLGTKNQQSKLVVQTCHILRNDFNINKLISKQYYLATTNSYLQKNLTYTNKLETENTNINTKLVATDFSKLGIIGNKNNFAKNRQAYALYKKLPAFTTESDLINYIEEKTNISASTKFFIQSIPYVLKDDTTFFLGKNLLACFNSCFISNYAKTVLDQSWFMSDFGQDKTKPTLEHKQTYDLFAQLLPHLNYYISLKNYSSENDFDSLFPKIIIESKYFDQLQKHSWFNINSETTDNSLLNESSSYENLYESNLATYNQHFTQLKNNLFFDPKLFSFYSYMVDTDLDLTKLQSEHANSGFIDRQLFIFYTQNKHYQVPEKPYYYNSQINNLADLEEYDNFDDLLNKYVFIAQVNNLVVNSIEIEDQQIQSSFKNPNIKKYINQIPKDPNLLFYYLTKNYTLDPAYLNQNYESDQTNALQISYLTNSLLYLNFLRVKFNDLTPNDPKSLCIFDQDVFVAPPVFKVNYKKVIQVYQQQQITQNYLNQHGNLDELVEQFEQGLDNDNITNVGCTPDNVDHSNKTDNQTFNFNQASQLLLYSDVNPSELTYPSNLDQSMDQLKLGIYLQKKLNYCPDEVKQHLSYILDAKIIPTINYPTGFNDLLPHSDLISNLNALDYKYILEQSNSNTKVSHNEQSREQQCYSLASKEIKYKHKLYLEQLNQDFSNINYIDYHRYPMHHQVSKEQLYVNQNIIEFREFVRFYNLAMPSKQHLPVCCELSMLPLYDNHFNYNYHTNFDISFKDNYVNKFAEQVRQNDEYILEYNHKIDNLEQYLKDELNNKFIVYPWIPNLDIEQSFNDNNANVDITVRKGELSNLIANSYEQQALNSNQAKLLAFYNSLDISEKIILKAAIFNYDLTQSDYNIYQFLTKEL